MTVVAGGPACSWRVSRSSPHSSPTPGCLCPVPLFVLPPPLPSLASSPSSSKNLASLAMPWAAVCPHVALALKTLQHTLCLHCALPTGRPEAIHRLPLKLKILHQLQCRQDTLVNEEGILQHVALHPAPEILPLLCLDLLIQQRSYCFLGCIFQL